MNRDRSFAGVFLSIFLMAVGAGSPLFAQPDPGANSSLFLTGGTLNGVDISSRRVVVQPGEAVSGTVTLQYTSQFQGPSTVTLAATPTWGDPATSGIDLGTLSTPAGNGTVSVEVDFVCPWTLGSHHLLFAFQQQYTADHVLSMTDWLGGAPVWYDGNDIADWNAFQLQQLSSQGRVTGSLLNASDTYVSVGVPATALEVVVIAGDPAENSSVEVVGGFVNGVDLSRQGRVVVAPGAAISGTVRAEVESFWSADRSVRLISTASWGDPRVNYTDEGLVEPGDAVYEVPVDFHAPQTAGAYAVIVACRADLDAAYLASMTDMTFAGPVWGDDNDIARWNPEQIDAAEVSGLVIGQLLVEDGAYQDTYVPAAVVEIVVDDTDPGTVSDLFVVSGELANVELIEGHNRVFVRAGEPFTGTVGLRYANAWPPGSGVAFGVTPTWGDPALSGIDLVAAGVNVDSGAAVVPVSLTAPMQSGLYHLFFAYRAEETIDNVLSMTSPVVAAPVWGDGNDVGEWGDDEHDEALENGRVLGRRLEADGSYRHLYVPAAGVEVVVTGDDPGADSALYLSSGVFQGDVVTEGRRQLQVSPGEVVEGTVNLRYTSAWSEDTRVQLAWTPTWGDPATSGVPAGVLATPSFADQLTVPVQFTAPSSLGIYRLVFAFRAADNAAELLSMTEGAAEWNDGNDIAQWQSSQFQDANENGRARASLETATGVQQVWVPATTIEVVVDSIDPGNQSSLELVSGVINGIHLPTNWARQLTVAPGQCLFGDVQLAYTSAWPADQQVLFGLTPSWGDPAAAYTDLRQLATPAVGAPIDVRINLNAPTSAGTYWLVFAFRGSGDGDHLFSMTEDGREADWTDDNEVATWSRDQLNEASSNGRTRARLLGNDGRYADVIVPATAIQLVVEETDFGATSALHLIGGELNGTSVGQAQRRVHVPAGGAIGGQVRLGWASTWPEGTQVPLGVTTSWGNPAFSVSSLGSVGSPLQGERTVTINETAPAEKGLHRMIFAFRGDEGLAEVFSMTDGDFGAPVWGDGNDIAGWGLEQTGRAVVDGRATGILRYPSGLYISTDVPATVVDVDTTAQATAIEDPAAVRLVVPATADTPGAYQTRWLSELVLHNPGNGTVEVRIYFLARNGNGSDGVVGRTVSIPAQESRKLESVLSRLFEQQPAVGGLLLAADGPLMVSSATYNPVNGGRYGQHIVGMNLGDLVHGSEPAALIRLTSNEQFRTNVGFVNTTPTALNLEVRYFLASGSELGSRGYQVPAYGLVQVDGALSALGVGPIDDAFAVVRAVEDHAVYAAYSSVVNRVTGDPVYGAPVRASDEALYVGGMANAVGRFNTYWLSDLELYNPTDELAECDLRFRLADQYTVARRRQVTVPAHSSVRLSDLVGETFRISGTGGLQIVPLQGSIAASAQTYNVGGINGQYGQNIPAFFDENAIEDDETGRIIHLANSIDLCSGFRTNIGVINASPIETNIEVALYRGDGTYMLTRILRLYPWGYHQENDILNCVTRTNVFDGYAVVRAADPEVRFFAFASVVDTVSGDALYIPAQKPEPTVR